MKAISLYEPCATLISLGEKRYETRSWSTTYRGPLLICSSKKKIPLYKYPPIKKVLDALFRHDLFLDDLKFGYALAIVDLIHVYRCDDLRFAQFGEQEEYFGDFGIGRFAWKLENVRRFKNPPLIRGRQGLFDVDDSYRTLETYDPIT